MAFVEETLRQKMRRIIVSLIFCLRRIIWYNTKKASISQCLFVVSPGFEPGQTEPKPVVLPLHHETILVAFTKAVQK